MGIDETQESRLLAREVPHDDPTWGEVSAFLEAVDATYAGVPTSQYEAAHLAAVAREARLLGDGLQTHRRKTMKDRLPVASPRVLIASAIAALLAVTAGVGAASALGGGPLAALLPTATTAPAVDPAPSVATPEPAPTEDGDDQGEDADDPTPKATPTATHDDDTDSEGTHSRSDDGDDDEQGDKASASHDDGDEDEADEADDESDDQPRSDAGHHDGGEDDGDNGGEDDSED